MGLPTKPLPMGLWYERIPWPKPRAVSARATKRSTPLILKTFDFSHIFIPIFTIWFSSLISRFQSRKPPFPADDRLSEACASGTGSPTTATTWFQFRPAMASGNRRSSLRFNRTHSFCHSTDSVTMTNIYNLSPRFSVLNPTLLLLGCVLGIILI